MHGINFCSCKYLDYGKRKIYYFGGDNVELQADTGRPYAGWYADEINNHHQNTIVECFNRTVVSLDRRIFWTLNPHQAIGYIQTT